MLRFLLLFVGLPLIEFTLLMRVGEALGGWNAVLLVLLTGVLGAQLARSQGLAVLAKLQAELGAGRMPAGTLLEAVIVFVSGLLLLTPGFLTDGIGLLCLLPPVRAALVIALARSYQRAKAEGRLHVGGRGSGVNVFWMGGRPGQGPMSGMGGMGGGPMGGPMGGQPGGPGTGPQPGPMPGPGGGDGGIRDATVVRNVRADGSSGAAGGGSEGGDEGPGRLDP